MVDQCHCYDQMNTFETVLLIHLIELTLEAHNYKHLPMVEKCHLYGQMNKFETAV